MTTGKCKDFRCRASLPILLMAASLALAGCGNKSARLDLSDPFTTASTAPASLRDTAALGERWRKNPADIRLGLAYANQLKSLDQTASMGHSRCRNHRS